MLLKGKASLSLPRARHWHRRWVPHVRRHGSSLIRLSCPLSTSPQEFEAQLEAHGRNETADSVPKDVLAGMLSDHVSADSLTMPLQDGKVRRMHAYAARCFGHALPSVHRHAQGTLTALTYSPAPLFCTPP